jgi:hypothetical protein
MPPATLVHIHWEEEPRLSNHQVDYFRTFDSVVLSGLLAAPTSAVRAEIDVALQDADAATYDQRVLDGISGHRRGSPDDAYRG